MNGRLPGCSRCRPPELREELSSGDVSRSWVAKTAVAMTLLVAAEASAAAGASVGSVVGSFVGSPAFGAIDDFVNPGDRDLSRAEQRAIGDLIDGLDASDPRLRNLSLRRLAAVGPAAIASLREHLESTANPKRLSMAVLALSAIGDPGGFATLQRRFLEEGAGEDELRALLLGLGQDQSATWVGDRAKVLRKLVEGSSSHGVTRLAVLIAANSDLVDFERIAVEAFPRTREHEIQAAYLVGLAERRASKTAGMVVGVLEKERNSLVRRAALYAAAKLEEPGPWAALRRFRPIDPKERRALAIALGSDPSAQAVEDLRELLVRWREPAVLVSLALHAADEDSAQARGLLLECLEGRFDEAESSTLSVAACRASTMLSADQGIEEALRRCSESPRREVRSAALLSLAERKDATTANRVRPQLKEWIDPSDASLEASILLCTQAFGASVQRELPEKRRKGRTGDESIARLCRLADEVADQRRDPRVLESWLHQALVRDRAHYSLQRDDLRSELVAEILALDDLEDLLDLQARQARQEREGTESNGGDTGGGGNGSSGGDGSSGGEDGGGGDGGSGDGNGSGDGGGSGGGDGSGGDDGGGSDPDLPEDPGPPIGGGEGGASNPLSGLRSGRTHALDRNRFEVDLLYWLRDHPLFQERDPFVKR